MIDEINNSERGNSLNHFKVADNVNVLPMLKEVALQWFDFSWDTGRQDTIPEQRMTKTIYLRRAKLKTTDIHEDVDTTRDTATYIRYPKVREFMEWFEKEYGGEVYRVLIVYLPKDGVVDPHIDYGKYYANKDRFHLVLSGYYENIVAVPTQYEDTDRELYSAGELWWFDNKKTHYVENKSEIPRIAIIFDSYKSNWQQ